MSGRASRQKGKRGELEVVAILKDAGLDCWRTPNSGGLAIPGDICGIPGYSFEVKRAERLDVPRWLAQAHAAASGGSVPVLVFRRDARGVDPCGDWHAVVPMSDFASMLTTYLERSAA